jgi:hypothetical protein
MRKGVKSIVWAKYCGPARSCDLRRPFVSTTIPLGVMGDSPQSPAQNTVYRPNNTTRILGVYEVEYVSKGYERI